jgi:hypothetical protein
MSSAAPGMGEVSRHTRSCQPCAIRRFGESGGFCFLAGERGPIVSWMGDLQPSQPREPRNTEKWTTWKAWQKPQVWRYCYRWILAKLGRKFWSGRRDLNPRPLAPQAKFINHLQSPALITQDLADEDLDANWHQEGYILRFGLQLDSKTFESCLRGLNQSPLHTSAG